MTTIVINKHLTEPLFKLIRWKIPVVPSESTLQYLRVDSFLGYSAVFMEKGHIFQKESTLFGYGYYEKMEGRPNSFVQLVYKVFLSAPQRE